jgi:septal ring factor EnvC (AmiA/AmiB activator)
MNDKYKLMLSKIQENQERIKAIIAKQNKSQDDEKMILKLITQVKKLSSDIVKTDSAFASFKCQLAKCGKEYNAAHAETIKLCKLTKQGKRCDALVAFGKNGPTLTRKEYTDHSLALLQ